MCIGAYAAPLLLIAMAYAHITWKVHIYSRRFQNNNSSVQFSSASQQKETEKKPKKMSRSMKREISTAKITFLVVMCWTIAWTPYAMVALIGIAGYSSALSPLAAQLPALFAKTAAVYNPFGKLKIKKNS
nr:rhabdomeric opsin [Acutuncus antarcticus]